MNPEETQSPKKNEIKNEEVVSFISALLSPDELLAILIEFDTKQMPYFH
jgi:hypothetical protein